MRSLVLSTFSLGLLFSGLLSQNVLAQNDGGIARLSSAAYNPSSPVTENNLFRLQTGRYGFTYNCDGEEEKRNHPAICWRAANREQLPRRMGCLERVRHEMAQVSQRILDGMCKTECGNSACQQAVPTQSVNPSCGCAHCLTKQQTTSPTGSTHPVQLSTLQPSAAPTDPQKPIEVEAAPASPRRSGLIRVTRVSPVTEVERPPTEDLQPSIEDVQLPTARIASATTEEGVKQVAQLSELPPATDAHQMGLQERLKRVQAAQ